MRLHNEKHLAFIRTLPCLICRDNISTEAAHIRYADAKHAKPITGVGIKPDDRYTVPLCGRHHREQHSMSERSFWEHYGLDPIPIALRLYSISGDLPAAQQIIGD